MSGAWKQCPNGHRYNPSIYTSCPHCGAGPGVQRVQEYGATMPLDEGAAPLKGGVQLNKAQSGGVQEYPPTEPAGPASFQYPPTEPAGPASFQHTPTVILFDQPAQAAGTPAIHDFDKGAYTRSGYGIHDFDTGSGPQNMGATEQVSPYAQPGAGEPGVTVPVGSYPASPMEDVGPTVPLRPFTPSDGRGNFSPVVGWLVCIEGRDRGRDYRIHAGYNSIGRSERMDIYIAGDDTISRERHARIAYDPEERVFYFGPDEGKNLVRLNGKLVMGYSELHPYDIVSISRTKLMFVPFCGERFNWDE